MSIREFHQYPTNREHVDRQKPPCLCVIIHSIFTMSGHWISVCILLVALSGTKSAAFFSEEDCFKCPDPVRPTNILGEFNLTFENTFDIDFELRPCKQSGGGQEDFTFRLMRAYIDCEPYESILDRMSDWEKYSLCDDFCSLKVQFDHYQELAFQRTVQAKNYIVFDCDTGMRNCTVPLWRCGLWPQEKNELKFLQITKEILFGSDL